MVFLSKYDYEGEGYAVWKFCSGAQDGPSKEWLCVITMKSHFLYSDVWLVINIKAEGNPIEG